LVVADLVVMIVDVVGYLTTLEGEKEGQEGGQEGG